MSKAEKIEEAIQVVNAIFRNVCGMNKSMEVIPALSTTLIALNKQKPRKAKNRIRNPVCPLCYRDIPLEPIDHSVITYCIYCGQAIDWTEEEWKK